MKKKLLILALSALPFLSQAQGWPDNYGGVMLQAFSWNSFGDTKWKNLTKQAEEMSQYFNLVWVPQSGWTGNSGSMGYDPKYYFDQHSAFGSEAELRTMINTFKGYGTGMIADIVVNHRGNLSNWVDFPEETYNGVTYKMYSTDICKNDDGGETANHLPAGMSLSANNDEGEDWSGMRDLDHKSENVRNVIKAYLGFLVNDIGYTGFRYDMTRGFGANRVAEYNASCGVQYSVGEYWSNQNDIQNWINNCKWNNVNMSASFDFPFRYTVRDVVRGYRDGAQGTKITWKDLTVGGVMASNAYKRYAVTFVENHDTQDRTSVGGGEQDPIKKDTLAANAYLLTMPGTPCVFLPHWKAYKQEIKNMIDVRKAVGVTNSSTAQKYSTDRNYELSAFKSSGADGKAMYCLVGNNKHTSYDRIVTQYYASILNEAVEVTKGYGYRLFMSKNCETAWVDKANGKYKNAFTATLTAVTATSGAKLVYTLDGSTPTASSTQVESGATINITQPCTLKVGLLKGSAVSGIVTRTYEFSAASRFINVYVNVENVGWDPVRYYTWDQVDAQHNGNWPGEAITTTTQIAGHTWYVKQYELEDDDCYINFVFNTGASGSPQTIDVLEATTDMYYVVKNTKQGDKYVVEAIDDPANFTLDTVPGDVNGDGEVTGSDVTALYNHILFGQDTAIFNGDQNGDGEVTGSDVTAVYNIILGL